MTYLILADIHGNLNALKSVLEKAENYKRIVVLGDVSGYGPKPQECIDLLSNYNPVYIKGNHEDAIFNKTLLSKFNNFAKESHRIITSILPQETLEFLYNLPFTYRDEDAYFVHATPFKPQDFYYILPGKIKSPTLDLSFIMMKNKEINVAFTGHSHIPGVFIQKDNKITYEDLIPGESFKLDENKRYIINCGSVGQPRNRNSDSSYVIYDSYNKIVIYCTTPYDIDSTVREIKELSLPEILYQRLYEGI